MMPAKRTFDVVKTIWKSQKMSLFPSNAGDDSFTISESITPNFIEPDFTTEEWVERPRIILISAVGASGKTTLANALSYSTKSIKLDLALHAPVGANSLTGLLTKSFATKDLSNVFGGLMNGSFGIIVDGIDEGKAKTSPDAFYAFLDDIITCCGHSNNQGGTSFIILGRSNVIDECFLYFDEQKVSVSFLQLSPFTSEQAKKYIDKYVGEDVISTDMYSRVRDGFISRLSSALTLYDKSNTNEIMRFLGYAPVLDTISTIIVHNANLYKLQQDLENQDITDAKVLPEILNSLMRREQIDKVLPNIILPRALALKKTEDRGFEDRIYTPLEQAHRLIAYCNNQPCSLNVIKDRTLNVEYEEMLNNSLLPEHPFLDNRKFRNRVFESYVLAIILLSNDQSAKHDALHYIKNNLPSYYLIIFMLQYRESDAIINLNQDFVKFLIQAALELETRRTFVDIDIDQGTENDKSFLDVFIEFSDNSSQNQKINIRFYSDDDQKVVVFGNYLANISANLPDWSVELGIGEIQTLNILPPVDIIANKIKFNARQMELLPAESIAMFKVCDLNHQLISIQKPSGLQIFSPHSPSYPLVLCWKALTNTQENSLEHALCLRRILMLFRSHSKGGMARLRDKIEHRRVIKDDWGSRLLQRLLSDGILIKKDNKFYSIIPEKIDEILKVNWNDLRHGNLSSELFSYVNSI